MAVTTLKALVEQVQGTLAASPFSMRQSPVVFNEETAPDPVQHRCFVVLPAEVQARDGMNFLDWDVDLEVRVMYLANAFLGDEVLVTDTILADVQAMFRAFAAYEERRPTERLRSGLASTRDGQGVLLSMLLPMTFCENF